MHEPAGVVEILVKIPQKYRIPPPPNENCQRVQIQEFQNTPLPKWKLSESPNLRVSEYPPNENCQRVQIWEFQNTPLPKWKLSESPNLRVSEYPPMKIVIESKSESFRIPPPPWKLSRVQILEFQNTTPPPKSEKLQISNFRIVLQPRRSYVQTNL